MKSQEQKIRTKNNPRRRVHHDKLISFFSWPKNLLFSDGIPSITCNSTIFLLDQLISVTASNHFTPQDLTSAYGTVLPSTQPQSDNVSFKLSHKNFVSNFQISNAFYTPCTSHRLSYILGHLSDAKRML
jgi:hypothetical protein